jgi:uncharacterized protein YndB with AHSA1/START domain
MLSVQQQKKNNKIKNEKNNTEMDNIRKEFIVNASQETAFRVFTRQMDTWWPRTHHIGKAPMTEMALEPKTKGRWFSRHEDGSEANVGEVLVWAPDDFLALAWQINGDFIFDPLLVTEVVVHFIRETPERTRILFEHRNMDKLSGGSKVIEDMNEGWGQILDQFKKIAES